MKNEEKILLLLDLCARLPYGLFVEENREKLDQGPVIYTYDYHPYITDCKPYLRPMSSMTEEEKSWYESLRNALTYQENGEYDLDDFNELNDFLNRKKLDRYGLIEKGLALEAPEGMY